MDTLDAKRFSKCCGLTWQQIYDDIASVVELTGFESQAELDLLHNEIFHFNDDLDFDDEFETNNETAVNDKRKRAEEGQWSCNICPPWRGENTVRRTGGKRGRKKPKYKNKNKKQGRAIKDLDYTYNEDESCSEFAKRFKKAGKR